MIGRDRFSVITLPNLIAVYEKNAAGVYQLVDSRSIEPAPIAAEQSETVIN